MTLLLKNCIVVDAASSHHNKKCNVLIEEGIITSLKGTSADVEIDASGKVLTAGWFDLNANFSDPGREDKEDLRSGSLAAFCGGFTDVQLMPNTDPVVESKADVEYIKKYNTNAASLHIAPALSEGTSGENLTEILDLHAAGATAVTDGDAPIWNSELLLKALQYTTQVNIPIFQTAQDQQLSRGSHMHEGKVSTNLGLRGEPGLSEEITIKRDLDILRYAGGRLHFSRISSAGSVDLIAAAKKEGLKVTADVAIHNLLFTDESVADFDTHFKAVPPYRTDEDRKSLIKGIKSGTIDAICSNHRPHDQESKQLEFDLAAPGTIALQTFYPSLLQLSKQVPFEKLLPLVTSGPRNILGMDYISVEEGSVAKLTLLDPDLNWTLDNQTNQSKSRNSPFWGLELKGKVIATVNGTDYQVFQ